MYEYSLQNDNWQLIGSEIQGDREDHRLVLMTVQNAVSDDGSMILCEEVDIESAEKSISAPKSGLPRLSNWVNLGISGHTTRGRVYIQGASLSGNGEVISLAVYKDRYPGKSL